MVWSVILHVVLLLGAATVLGLLTQRLGQGPILGALLAGLLLGPGVLGIVPSGAFLDVAGELGVTLLLFTVGLEFSWAELARLGRMPVWVGALQVVLTLLAIAGVIAASGRSLPAGLVAGSMIALSSTASVLATLRDRAETDTLHGRLATAVLLLQDMAVVPLVLLVAALAGEASAGATALAALGSIAAALALAGILWFLSRRVLPKLLGATASSGSRDLPILVSVTTCLFAAWTAHRLHVSPGIGAFVAGLLLAGSPFATRVRADIGALRALFVTAFFATVGMRADVAWMGRHALLVVGASVALVLGKALIAMAVAMAFGVRLRVAIATGLLLAQVGEFAFVLAGVAGATDLLGADVTQLIVATAIVSLLVTPALVRWAPDVGRWLEETMRRAGLLPTLDDIAKPLHRPREGHVLVLGLGPAGRGAALALQSKGHDVVAIELSARAAAQAEREGVRVIVGDAANEETLRHAGLERAAAAVLAVPDLRASLEILGVVRAIAPSLPVVARSRYHAHALHLLGAGAALVADEEWDTGGRLGHAVVELLGESPPSEDDWSV